MPSKKQITPAASDEFMKAIDESGAPMSPTPAPVPETTAEPVPMPAPVAPAKPKVVARKPRAPKKTVVKTVVTKTVTETPTPAPAPVSAPEPEPAPVSVAPMPVVAAPIVVAPVVEKPVVPMPKPPERTVRRTETITETQTGTKTSTALTVGVLAASALALAAAAAILSLSLGGPKICYGGPNAGQLCRTALECGKGATCDPVKYSTRPAGYNTPGYAPSTAPARIPKFGIGPAVADAQNSPGIIVAGEVNAVIAKLVVNTANEAWKIEKMRVSITNPDMIDHVSVLDESTGAVPQYTVTPVSGLIGVYDISNGPIVSADATRIFRIMATVRPIGHGAKSGAVIKASMLNVPGTFLARSQTTGATYNAFGYDVIGPEKIIRKSKPIISAATLPISTLGSGTQTLARFTVTASASGDIALKKISFSSLLQANGSTMTLTTAGGSGIRPVGEAATIAGQTLFGPQCNGTTTMPCFISTEFTNQVIIAAGTSQTFEFRANVTGGGAGSSITTTIAGDETQDVQAVVTGEMDGAPPMPAVRIDDLDGNPQSAYYNFVWSDMSASQHNDRKDTNGDGANDSAASDDWTNGVYAYRTGDVSWTLAR